MPPCPDNCRPPAPLWRRWASFGYDLFILAALSMAYGALATGLQQLFTPITPADYQPTLQHPVFFIGWCTLILAYYCLSWLKTGQTIGMKAWGIQLTPLRGALTPQKALLRCLAGLTGTLLFGLGYVYKAFNANKDCWQDAITHTRIVKTGATKP